MAKKYKRGQRSQIENMLWSWGDGIRRLRIPGLSFPSESMEYRMMREGCARADSGRIHIPNYWPNDELVEMGKKINNLRSSLRELVNARFVYVMDLDEIKAHLQISESTYFNWLKEAYTYLNGAMGIEQ